MDADEKERLGPVQRPETGKLPLIEQCVADGAIRFGMQSVDGLAFDPAACRHGFRDCT